MIENDGLATTIADQLNELGGISLSRVRSTPPMGTAELADLIHANESGGRASCELVNGTLVEKAMSYEASVVAIAIARILGGYISMRRLGLVSGPDGFFRFASSVRGPDVAFVARDRLPGGTFPRQPYPALSPNLVVEVLSPGNTKSEMARKRFEYFHAGVQAIWIVDVVHRSVAVYTSMTDVNVLGEQDTITAGEILAGFSTPVAEFFTDLDIGLDLESDASRS